MPINQISTQNTFGEWVAATTNLITISNNLTDNFLVSNALITLSRSGISLNVTNSAIINSLTANTINISSTTGNLIVSGNTTLAYANVTKVLTVKDLVVQGTYSLGTASYINIDASGYINAATYLKSTNYLSVGTFINQSGANNTFAGQTAFINAATSITTLGNVSFGKNATITENLTVNKNLNVSGNTYILKNLGVGTSNPAYRMVVQDTAPGTYVVQQLLNEATTSGSRAVFQLNVGTTKYINLINDYNAGSFNIVGTSITTKYEDFDTQFWRNNIGVELLKLTAASLNVSSNLNVTGSANISNNLSVTKNVTISGILSVTGNTNLGNLSIGGGLAASGKYGNTGDVLISTGSGINWSNNRTSIIAYSTAGTYTWTKQAGLRGILVEIIGGGGGGGGSQSTVIGRCAAGAGGGAGGYARVFLANSSVSSPITVTVGAGGAAGSSAGGDGGTGTTTSFGAVVSATGGVGGGGYAGGASGLSGETGGAGGNVSGTSDFAILGGSGGFSVIIGSSVASPVGFAGHGGSGYFGGGGRGAAAGSSLNGAIGRSPGSGGGGAVSTDVTSNTGGSGADGCVIITELYI